MALGVVHIPDAEVCRRSSRVVFPVLPEGDAEGLLVAVQGLVVEGHFLEGIPSFNVCQGRLQDGHPGIRLVVVEAARVFRFSQVVQPAFRVVAIDVWVDGLARPAPAQVPVPIPNGVQGFPNRVYPAMLGVVVPTGGGREIKTEPIRLAPAIAEIGSRIGQCALKKRLIFLLE